MKETDRLDVSFWNNNILHDPAQVDGGTQNKGRVFGRRGKMYL